MDLGRVSIRKRIFTDKEKTIIFLAKDVKDLLFDIITKI